MFETTSLTKFRAAFRNYQLDGSHVPLYKFWGLQGCPQSVSLLAGQDTSPMFFRREILLLASCLFLTRGVVIENGWFGLGQKDFLSKIVQTHVIYVMEPTS